jgi:hypothetical protein
MSPRPLAQLLLSKNQILALEQADATPFYSHAYFLQGLRKYMALAGLPADLLNEALEVAEDDDALRMTLAAPPPRRAVLPALSLRSWQAVAATLAAGVIGALAYPFLPAMAGGDGRSASTVLTSRHPLPSTPTVVPAVAPSLARAVPAALHTREPDASATVHISVGKATWVFVRYPDNRVTERRLEAGQEMVVGPLPIYLAVGIADDVEVRVEDRPVELDRYIRNGQIRITRPELAALRVSADTP